MKIGITQSAYCHYEKNIRQPSVEILQRLANLYNMSIDDLIGDYPIKQTEDISEDQHLVISKLLRLNEMNLIKATSFMAGLYVGQS